MQEDLARDAARHQAALWRRVRWAAAVFALVQFLAYRPPAGVQVPYDVLGPGLALTGVLVAVNAAAARLERHPPRHAPDPPAKRALVLLLVDLAVVAAAVLLFVGDAAAVLWPLLALPLLEAGLLGRLPWALRAWAAALVVLAALQWLPVLLLDRAAPDASQVVTAFCYRAGVLLLVALVAGVQASSTARYVRLLHDAQEQLAHEASHDHLTGAAARSLFLDRTERALREQRERGGRTGVLFVDCDGFKGVNDTHGHAAGDEVLVQVAQRLRTGVRPADTVARLGGDEFGVLLERLDDPHEADGVAARVRAALAPAYRLSDGSAVTMGCSVGLAVDEGPGDALAALLGRADAAMYRGKGSRRT